MALRLPCNECGRVLLIKGRGLCHKCHGDRSIRAKYPSRKTSKFDKAMDRDPTAEELEQMIAEQMANLPEWWEREADKTYEPIGDKQYKPVRVLCCRTGELFFR